MSDSAAGYRGCGGTPGRKFFLSDSIRNTHLWHGGDGGHQFVDVGGDGGEHHLTQLGALASSPEVAMAMAMVITTMVLVNGDGNIAAITKRQLQHFLQINTIRKTTAQPDPAEPHCGSCAKQDCNRQPADHRRRQNGESEGCSW